MLEKLKFNITPSFIDKIFKNELIRMYEGFNELFDKLEVNPQIIVCVDDVIEKSELIIQELLKLKSSRLTVLAYNLQRKRLGFKYRVLKEKKVSIIDTNELELFADQWIQNQIFFKEEHLNKEQKEIFKMLQFYKDWTELFKLDEKLRLDFFNWSLRDRLSLEIFIEFPNLTDKIIESKLSGRISRIDPNYLHTDYEKGNKCVKLLFEGVEENILDESKIITFRGNYKLSVKEVFNIFKDKERHVGHLEFLNRGIINWNSHECGFWNAEKNEYEKIQLETKGWWRQLPCIQIVEASVLSKTYDVNLNGQDWAVVACATRSSSDLDFENCHAYMEVAIPIDPIHYAIFDFGKSATYFPKNLYESMSMACKNVYATVAYPDDNIYYTHRQTVKHAFVISKEKGFNLMNHVKKDMQNSREKNFVYQIESDNCAKWLHEHIEKILGKDKTPNLFKISLLSTESKSIIGKIFALVKMLPQAFQIKTLTMLHLPFGAKEGIWIREEGVYKKKSLKNHDFWMTGIVFLPAYLHKQKELGDL